jgi:hypothetical protein
MAPDPRGLDALRRWARIFDSAFRIPGTRITFGLDPILGLIPGLGDLVSPLFAIGLLWQARELGVPKVVQLRMIVNVALDTLLGLVPVVGDLFDFAWKANNMNLALLERHAYEEHRASAGDWLFVAMAIAVLVALAVLPFFILGWLFTVIAGWLT